MVNQIRRLAVVMAMLWFGFVVGDRVASADLLTPAGVSPGQSFRFVFVTDGTTDATSSDINYYNTFVNAQAGGATYNGATIQWLAIASTPTVSAISNIGITGAPIYRPSGTEVAASDTLSGGMWGPGYGYNLLAPIEYDLKGALVSGYVWTGTLTTGSPETGYSLGDARAEMGWPGRADYAWIEGLLHLPTLTSSLPLYAISQQLTAPTTVPEPSSALIVGTAICAGVAISWSRRRRAQRWQRPERQPEATE